MPGSASTISPSPSPAKPVLTMCLFIPGGLGIGRDVARQDRASSCVHMDPVLLPAA
jgi:hypothetical protein